MPTIEQIELDLPNGFHDAELYGLDVDYELGELTMRIGADLSDPDTSSGEPEYRRGELIIKGLAFLSIDAPRSLSNPQALWLSSGPGQPSTSPIQLPSLPEGCFLHWFFVNQWNAFIRVAARDAEWRWAGSGSS